MGVYSQTIGRRYAESPKDVFSYDPFMRDELRIRHSKAHRRLPYKTQAISLPINPHIRTRGEHTNEVVLTAASISELLGLNTQLCRAIAEGHDIGHTPYGHLGEEVIYEMSGKKFRHNLFSVVLAQQIERDGKGLNLCYETLEGMLYHSRGGNELKSMDSLPQEYSVVMYADKIAGISSDYFDAERNNCLNSKGAVEYANKLGKDHHEITRTIIKALYYETMTKGRISFSEGEVYDNFITLKKFMYDEVYKGIDDQCYAMQKTILKEAYNFFAENQPILEVHPVIATALLTDREADEFGHLMLRARKPKLEHIKHFGVFEIIKHIKGKNIDWMDPDLKWKDEAHRCITCHCDNGFKH